MAADVPHARLIYALLETLRERSIAVRAARVEVPADWVQDPARLGCGASNYDAMCAGCHLSPGVAASELSQGLYPKPPNLAEGRCARAGARVLRGCRRNKMAHPMPS